MPVPAKILGGDLPLAASFSHVLALSFAFAFVILMVAGLRWGDHRSSFGVWSFDLSLPLGLVSVRDLINSFSHGLALAIVLSNPTAA